jgi:GNAT superfamily N-acetyltransferase
MVAQPVFDAGALLIREVRAGDDAAIERLLGGLDAESRYRRWFTGGVDIAGAERWAAHPERVGAVGLLAFAGEEPVGHAVLVPATAARAEVAFEVAAPWRRHGIAGALLQRLIELAAARGFREVYADVLPENADMLAVLREHGEHAEAREGGVLILTLATEVGAC